MFRRAARARVIPWIGLYCIASNVGCSGEQSTHDLTSPTSVASTPQSDDDAIGSQPVSGVWPQWRGPESRGQADATRLPPDFPPVDIQPVWAAELGEGWSSPIVAGGRVFLTDRSGAEERVRAFDAATGKPLWTRPHAVDFDPHPVGQRHGNGPKSTPLHFDGRVYALGIAGWLECLDEATGQVVWTINLPQRFGASRPLPSGRAFVEGTDAVIVPIGDGQGAPVPLFGYTGSPTLADGKLVLSVGGRRGGTIMAFDSATGDEIWRSLSEPVSYSSPVVATLAGEPQVVVMTGPAVVGLRLADGRELWRHPFQIQYDESISTPAVSAADGLVLATGDSRPLTALRIERRGDAISKQVAWTSDLLSSYLSSMVVANGHVYGMNDGGEFACLRLADGEPAWVDGQHGYYCSPVLVGDRLLCLNDRAELTVVDAAPSGFRQSRREKLANGPSWTIPAIAEGRIYVRSAGRLACFDMGRDGAPRVSP